MVYSYICWFLILFCVNLTGTLAHLASVFRRGLVAASNHPNKGAPLNRAESLLDSHRCSIIHTLLKEEYVHFGKLLMAKHKQIKGL